MEHLFNILEHLQPTSDVFNFKSIIKNQLSISVSNTVEIKNITLKNTNNEEINLNFKIKNQTITSSVLHLKSRLYFLEIKSNQGTNYKKICIK